MQLLFMTITDFFPPLNMQFTTRHCCKHCRTQYTVYDGGLEGRGVIYYSLICETGFHRLDSFSSRESIKAGNNITSRIRRTLKITYSGPRLQKPETQQHLAMKILWKMLIILGLQVKLDWIMCVFFLHVMDSITQCANYVFFFCFVKDSSGGTFLCCVDGCY